MRSKIISGFLLAACLAGAEARFGLLSDEHSSAAWKRLANSAGIELVVRQSSAVEIRIFEESVPDRVPTKRSGERVLSGNVRLPPDIAPAPFKFEPWEARVTAGERSTSELIRMLVEAASRGGRLLLKETATNGALEERLRGVGAWLKVNHESIEGTTYGPLQSLAFGRMTATEKAMYLHVFDWPSGGRLELRGVRAKVSGVTLLAGGKNLKFRQTGGQLVIEAPEKAPDGSVSVIAIAATGIPRGSDEPVPVPSKTGPPLRKAQVSRDRIEFVRIPPGEFMMGSGSGSKDEQPRHRVRITKGFEMSKYEVTQAQWEAVMGSNPGTFQSQDRPVESVSWNDAQQFLRKLAERRDGYRYRLPTEAEWEYAARAGMGGEEVGNLDAVAWHNGNSGGQTHEVGQREPNAWGLHDMHGNVWELCQDWYQSDYYTHSPEADPQGPAEGQFKVARGGSWFNYPTIGRPSRRTKPTPDVKGNHMGIRCVRTPDPRLEDVRAVMRDSVEQREIAGGSLLILHNGEPILREAFGYADLETRRPFGVDDLCFIASLSKSISATVAVMLDERGVISLDDPVEKRLPEFKGIKVKGKNVPASPPLIWQLLSHRSGLPGNDDPGAVRGRDARPPSLAEVVTRWAGADLLAEPGSRFAYGSAGYITLSRIVEVANGRRYDALTKELLLHPLGMSRTTYRPTSEQLKAMPRRYRRTKEGLQPDSGVYPVPGPEEWVNPAGGLFSTLDDMGRFVLMHLNGGKAGGKQIVDRDKLARMYRAHPGDGSYGLGLNVGGIGVRHLGGSGTFLWLDFENNSAVVLLTQVPWEGKQPLIQQLAGRIQSFYADGN